LRSVFQLAWIGRWQPAQLVVHDRWQEKQVILSLPCASPPSRAGSSLARAAFALYFGLPGVTVSFTSVMTHSRSLSIAERCTSLPPIHSKRLRPSCVRRSVRSMPPGRAAGPEVRSVG
jgi:hypothetical protein